MTWPGLVYVLSRSGADCSTTPKSESTMTNHHTDKRMQKEEKKEMKEETWAVAASRCGWPAPAMMSTSSTTDGPRITAQAGVAKRNALMIRGVQRVLAGC